MILNEFPIWHGEFHTKLVNITWNLSNRVRYYQPTKVVFSFRSTNTCLEFGHMKITSTIPHKPKAEFSVSFFLWLAYWLAAMWSCWTLSHVKGQQTRGPSPLSPKPHPIYNWGMVDPSGQSCNGVFYSQENGVKCD